MRSEFIDARSGFGECPLRIERGLLGSGTTRVGAKHPDTLDLGIADVRSGPKPTSPRPGFSPNETRSMETRQYPTRIPLRLVQATAPCRALAPVARTVRDTLTEGLFTTEGAEEERKTSCYRIFSVCSVPSVVEAFSRSHGPPWEFIPALAPSAQEVAARFAADGRLPHRTAIVIPYAFPRRTVGTRPKPGDLGAAVPAIRSQSGWNG